MENKIQELLKLRREHDSNEHNAHLLKERNIQLYYSIKQLEDEIRNNTITIFPTEDKKHDMINGYRCIICARIADIQCYICLNEHKPSGFCERHTVNHNEHGHKAIWQKCILPHIIPKPKQQTKPNITQEELDNLIQRIDIEGFTEEIKELCRNAGIKI